MLAEDQAGRLRRLMQQARRTRTIAVTSGKGGVGKSNVALNLAILLSAAGNRVALVDADLGLANIDVLVDVNVALQPLARAGRDQDGWKRSSWTCPAACSSSRAPAGWRGWRGCRTSSGRNSCRS